MDIPNNMLKQKSSKSPLAGTSAPIDASLLSSDDHSKSLTTALTDKSLSVASSSSSTEFSINDSEIDVTDLDRMSQKELEEEQKALEAKAAALIKGNARLEKEIERINEKTKAYENSIRVMKQKLLQVLPSDLVDHLIEGGQDPRLDLICNLLIPKEKVPKDVRKFAKTVYKLSPEVYRILGKTFSLPPVKTVRKWTAKSRRIQEISRK